MPWFLVYVLVELAVVVALTATIGFGWTLLVLLGTFLLGLALAGSQIKRQFQRLQTRTWTTPQGAVTDGALIALGTVLVFIPGLVTTALGLLLLVPPTRTVARPVLAALALRGMGGRAPLITVMSTSAGAAYAARNRQAPAGEYVDGEVIDVTEVQTPRLPKLPD